MRILRAGALVAAAALACAPALAERANPLALRMPDGTVVQNCADPTVIAGQGGGDAGWWMYCTKDALYDGGSFYRLPVFRSDDLVHWTFVGDALTSYPSWAVSGTNLWAPEIAYFRGKYHLYYAATDTKDAVSGEPGCAWDPAIGVGESGSAAGPFVDAGAPVVYPRRKGTGCNFAMTIDPDVILDQAGQRRIYYGNFNGGIEARELSTDGRTSDPATAVPVVIADRAEAPEVLYRNGWYWLLASVATCCSGPMSGYAVVAGRSASPTGPFLDREGVSLLAGRSGGTPVLGATGNGWVGPGHHTTVTDLSGQDWAIYHAIDEDKPYFAGSVGYTQRPAFLDPLDWVDGWPTVRGGWWVSACGQDEPVVVGGGTPTYAPTRRPLESPGAPVAGASDEFDGPAVGPQWSWIRPPSSGTALSGGTFRFNTQSAELHEGTNTASVLVQPAPSVDYVVETRMRLTVPAEGGGHNYAQGGLVIHRDDDNYVKLVHASIGVSRQTEYAKEAFPVPAGYPRYGKTMVGPPGEWTWMRIVRRAAFGGERYTAFTSLDGTTWTRGGTWRHALGPGARIGLVSMNRAGYTSEFDYVRVSELAAPECTDPGYADPCDADGDTVGDLCDTDDDGDLLADVLDCAETDPAQGVPDEVAELVLSGASPTALDWGPAARADGYDVIRGPVSALPSGDYGACLADDLADTAYSDAALPDPGDAFGYLVRGDDAGCGGGGSWGRTGTGQERVNLNPGTCP